MASPFGLQTDCGVVIHFFILAILIRLVMMAPLSNRDQFED